jgi:hypothetical protein
MFLLKNMLSGAGYILDEYRFLWVRHIGQFLAAGGKIFRQLGQ